MNPNTPTPTDRSLAAKVAKTAQAWEAAAEAAEIAKADAKAAAEAYDVAAANADAAGAAAVEVLAAWAKEAKAKAAVTKADDACDCGKIEGGRHHMLCPAIRDKADESDKA